MVATRAPYPSNLSPVTKYASRLMRDSGGLSPIAAELDPEQARRTADKVEVLDSRGKESSGGWDSTS